MAAPEYLTLCWNGRPLGCITEVQVFDWPWVCGRLTSGGWPQDLRAAVEAEARASDEDKGPSEPYPEGFFQGWAVVDPSGSASGIGVPRVGTSPPARSSGGNLARTKTRRTTRWSRPG